MSKNIWENYLTLLTIRRIKIKTTMRYYYQKDKKMPAGYKEEEALGHCLW